MASISDAAMTAVVEQYGDEMLRVAMLYLGNREQAEDAVQDAFLKIFRAARSDEIAKSFVMRVLVNTCKDYCKSSWAKRVILLDEYPETAAAPTGQPGETGRLLQEVQRLSPKYREVLLLRFYEGLSVGEIAQLLRAPQSTVSIRIKRACAILEKRLEGTPREDL